MEKISVKSKRSISGSMILVFLFFVALFVVPLYFPSLIPSVESDHEIQATVGTIVAFVVWLTGMAIVLLQVGILRWLGEQQNLHSQRAAVAGMGIGVVIGVVLPLYFHTDTFWTPSLVFLGALLAVSNFGLLVYFTAPNWNQVARGMVGIGMAAITQYAVLGIFHLNIYLIGFLRMLVVVFLAIAIVSFAQAFIPTGRSREGSSGDKPKDGSAFLQKLVSGLGTLISIGQFLAGTVHLFGTNVSVPNMLHILPK